MLPHNQREKKIKESKEEKRKIKEKEKETNWRKSCWRVVS